MGAYNPPDDKRDAEVLFSADMEDARLASSRALSEDEEALEDEELVIALVIALGDSFEATWLLL